MRKIGASESQSVSRSSGSWSLKGCTVLSKPKQRFKRESGNWPNRWDCSP